MTEGVDDFYFDFKSNGSADDWFNSKYSTAKYSPYQNTIMLTYFMFTSLSTVGFGDRRPCSDNERLVGAFLLMFGVSIFSYVMGSF